jgi:signal transduction histidine kinase
MTLANSAIRTVHLLLLVTDTEMMRTNGMVKDRSRLAELAGSRHFLNLAGIALPTTVWVLGLVSPPKGGLTPSYLVVYTALLVALVIVDQTTPSAEAPFWRRLAWLGAELVLSLFIVLEQGNLVRSTLIYLLPTSRVFLMFGVRLGLVLSLSVWAFYGLNVGLSLWPDRLAELPNYMTFLVAPFIAAVVLTVATLRQAADNQRLQTLYDALSRAHVELQALHQQAREVAVTQERNRIAREIHDSLAHYLTVINLQLEAAEKLSGDQPVRALDQVHRARRLALECLQEVRRSVAALRAASLEELSLPRALGKLVADFTDTTGINVQVDLRLPENIQLAPETTMALYRVAQEGLTNVQRHAHATTIDLSLATDNGHVTLALQDDGVGPPPDFDGDHGGFGLLGLRERVELLGGQVVFGPASPHGARLAVTVPSRVSS